MAVEEFLKNISEETGFKLGTPWRYSDKTLGVIVPILRDRDRLEEFEERTYITLEEAKDREIIFKDSGKIDRVIIESSIGKPIFIRSGTALKSGATQPRAVETSIVVIPEDIPKEEIPQIIITKQEIPVRCVYSSKPICSNEKFGYGGYVPSEVGSALLSRSGQTATWKAVSGSTNRFVTSSHSSGDSLGRSIRSRRITTDNLVGVMEEVDKFTINIDEILTKVPLFEDQVGAIFLDMKDVIGLELFDHPKSWEAIHKEVEKRLGESATKEMESFYKPDYNKVKPLTLTFLKKLIDSEKKEISRHGITSTVSLKGDGVIGEATLINGEVIHLIGMKDKKEKDKNVADIFGNVRAAHRNTEFIQTRSDARLDRFSTRL